MGLQEVSNILWRERQLMDLLLFKLEEERLVLTSGSGRWLNHATREAEMVLEELRETELGRAIEVAAIAEEFGLSPNASLQELQQRAPTPWDTIFAEHRRAFLEMAQEISSVTAANRDLLVTGQRATQKALAWLEDTVEPDLYSAQGVAATPRVSHLLDKSI